MPIVQVRLLNLNAIRAKMEVNVLLVPPWRTAVNELGQWLTDRVHARAPKETNRLDGSITGTMDPKPIALWFKISADAEKGGVRYPFVLEAGRKARSGERTWVSNGVRRVRRGVLENDKYIPLTYRSGPRKGRSTRKWMRGAMRGIRRKTAEVMGKAVIEIERRWRSRVA